MDIWAYILRKLKKTHAPQDSKIQKDTLTPRFTAALLKIVRTWKQPEDVLIILLPFVSNLHYFITQSGLTAPMGLTLKHGYYSAWTWRLSLIIASSPPTLPWGLRQ